MNPSEIPALCISYHYNAGENIIFHLKTSLPYKNKLVKTNHPTRNYTTIYIGLIPKQAQKLRNLVKKQGKTESVALRTILDAYFNDIDKKDLSYEPYRKFSPVGLKVLPRTVRKEQDRKLREIADNTGRRISELAREAVEKYFF